MIPRLGTPPRPDATYRLRPGAYAVLLHRGRVLLTEQTLSGRTELQLPGGGIDPGEAPLPALHREVFEETGHRCAILRRVGAYRRFTWMPEYGFHAEKLCTIYAGLAGPRLGPPSEPGHRAIWLAPDKAGARLANACDRAYLSRALRLL
ncbi:NUDIX hydrolase [Jannaschia sp. M317]|uniref:NUDIX hydrolase n=1 Tax=Jannaschia sp. M317 TaxID=2867011 RepID=UPI0021A61F5B|nr:NUDIX hydrolase [Jannaschia sp. M317]UWQ18117.1 NUDIX hydrolase [Jannaschia sp. M317]